MFAVFKSGGKQYRVEVGDVVKTERLTGEVGELISLTDIIAVGNKFSQTDLKSAVVKAEIVEHKKHDKIIVFKKKRRHNYRRKHGHRQQISVLRIKEVNC